MNPTVKQLSIQRFVKILALLVTCVYSVAVSAGDRQSLLTIVTSINDFVATEHIEDGELKVKPDPLDPRLRLAACQQALIAFWAPGSRRVGNTTVGVRCEGTRPWKLFIPTRVMLMQEVVVASRPLARGQRIARSDLTLDKRDVGRLRRSAIRDPAQIVGYIAKRALVSGKVIDTAMLKAPILVERGRRVRMAIESGGLTISMAGKAMEDGALGETVRIRNPTSKAIVEGVVTGPATVRLFLARKPMQMVKKR